MLQRHIEEGHDALIAARVGVLRRLEALREQHQPPPPPSARERPETREIETQTDKSEAAVNTRPNETQTDPCAKAAETDAQNVDDELNQPSTSKCVTNDIGMSGPSTSNSGNEAKSKAAENQTEPIEQSQEAEVVASVSGRQADENAEEQQAAEAEPVPQAVIPPNLIAEPPNRDVDVNDLRQRLIIIHQRRRDEFENAADRHR